MVLELKVPHDESWAGLKPLVPVFMSYVLSFVYVGIYWNNHHHTIYVVKHVGGGILWANLHFLFWLSLIPFVTGWMGENHFGAIPTAMYGFVLLMCAIAYTVLVATIVRHEGRDSLLAAALGRDVKGKVSVVAYLLAMVCAFFVDWLSQLIYLAVAMLWLIPDRRIESVLARHSNEQPRTE